MDGGIVGGGWYTILGGEQGGKSTLADSILCNVVSVVHETGRKLIAAKWDYEGSQDEEYTSNILQAQNVKADAATMFGVKDEATGAWLVKPCIRYYSHDVGEDFFDFQATLKRKLPDIEKHGKEYFYVFKHTKENKAKFAGMYDTKYLTSTNRIRVPAPSGFMQAITVLDSYAGMLPDRLDEEDKNEAMAEAARMFSSGLRKVKGGMRKKRMTVIGINQIRLNPGARFGNPEYEGGGQALKFFSDVRVKLTSRASTDFGGFKIDGGKVREPSATHKGGVDTYRFIHMKTIKNKLGGIPQREVWARIWESDATGAARGFDPAFDCWEYLRLLGFVEGTMANMKFHEDTPLHGLKKCDWLTFKTLVVGTKQQITEIMQDSGLKPGSIRKWIRKHCSSKKGPDRYKSSLLKKIGAATETASSDED